MIIGNACGLLFYMTEGFGGIGLFMLFTIRLIMVLFIESWKVFDWLCLDKG